MASQLPDDSIPKQGMMLHEMLGEVRRRMDATYLYSKDDERSCVASLCFTITLTKAGPARTMARATWIKDGTVQSASASTIRELFGEIKNTLDPIRELSDEISAAEED